MKLYKYFKNHDEKEDRIIDSLNGGLWFCGLSRLNDPFEGGFSIAENSYKKYVSENTGSMLAQARLDLIGGTSLFRDMLRSLFYSVSFSEVSSSLLMWSHYADEHRGYVIEYTFPENYNMLEAIGIDKKVGPSLQRVIYTDKMIEFSDLKNFGDMTHVLLRKSSEWGYEREVRTILIDKPSSQGGYLKRISGNLVTGVYLGMRNTGKMIKTIKNHRGDLMVYKMHEEYGRFLVSPRLI